MLRRHVCLDCIPGPLRQLPQPLPKAVLGPTSLVTSALVVAEGHGWFLRRYDQHRAVQFLNFLSLLPGLTIHAFDPDELVKASQLVKKYADRKLTLADAHGLAVMRERRIATCWSTDRHLGLTGVRLAV